MSAVERKEPIMGGKNLMVSWSENVQWAMH